MTDTLLRPMPTESDVAEIRTVARAFTGSRNVYEVTATSGGVLISYDSHAKPPVTALMAVGYNARVLRPGLVLATGFVDRLDLIEAQIAALTAERDRLLRAAEQDA